MQLVNNFDHYRVFYYVAEQGSMGRAAEALGMVPSSITKNVQALENALNCQLFIRTTRGVRMTREGIALFEKVKPAFKLLQTGEQEVRALLSLEGGVLTIGIVSDIIPNALTSNWLAVYQNSYPKIKVNMVNLGKNIVATALNSGEIDLALCGRPIHSENSARFLENVEMEELFVIRDVAVVGGKYGYLADHPRVLEELAEIPLIFASDHYSRAYQEYGLIYQKHRLAFDPNIKTCVVGMQVNAVRHGLGYSFVPEISIKKPVIANEVRVMHISNIEPYSRALCVATSPELPLSRAAAAFINIMRNYSNEDVFLFDDYELD